MKKLLTVLFCVLFVGMGLSAGKDSKSHHTKVVQELIELLKNHRNLENELKVSLDKAEVEGISKLDDYYEFLDNMVRLIPTDRNLLDHIKKFYFLIDPTGEGILQNDELFKEWMVKFAKDWGTFLDTPESAAEIEKFCANPDYHIEDYQRAPSGWYTFNQFFAREVRPGKRPIDDLCNDKVVVSPADSVFRDRWIIDDNLIIEVQGKGKYSIKELLDNSIHADKFKGGLIYHSFLNVNDYHHYHVPVAGTVLEARQIYGNVYLEMSKKNGQLKPLDNMGYQFKQARGLVVIDSTKHLGGYVAVLPIGMAQVSSVNITAQAGDWLHKGEKFGYFLFGGSDIIVMFDKDCKVELCMEKGTHYKQGVKVAAAK